MHLPADTGEDVVAEVILLEGDANTFHGSLAEEFVSRVGRLNMPDRASALYLSY